ncbi:MAG: amylo-alpha-1,6-glucosidase, partial [Thermodesulfobacteriota bacterium]
RKKSKSVKKVSYEKIWEKSKNELELFAESNCIISTSNEQFDNWLNRSYADLHIMLTKTGHGIYPYGGVPWFSTIFGRDGIITALQTLWINPEIAKGVLNNLVSLQAGESDPVNEAQPGKIIHEKRDSEMAMIGDVPFKAYYGSIDSTPLFIILAGSYLEHTGDLKYIKKIWPNIENALTWLDKYGDIDKDGFVEYSVHSSKGLINQGWKDSHDSVFHDNGDLAEGPIALCEVQGYVYMAKVKASMIAEILGFPDKAENLLSDAQTLKSKFNEVYWLEDLSTYALAIDGDKKPCRVVSSNPGHCLYTGIADIKIAKRLIETLLSENMFTKWGIRTLSNNEVRYNPMSYHNGSIWPHDNSIIAAGMVKYGFKKSAISILNSLYDASRFFELHRLPELYCGFEVREAGGPTLYPGACSPQAWAVGSIFLLLQSCLGIKVDGLNKQISFCKPFLPELLDKIDVKNLRINNSTIDLKIERYANDVGINVLKKKGPSTVFVEK